MKKRIVCLTLALLMSATQVVSVSASREDELREEQAITSQQLDATYSRMDELAYAKSQLENEISELDSNLVSVMVSIDTLKGDIDNKEVDIIKTKQDLAKAQKARDKQYESMKLRIQALYEQGGDAAWFQMMLNSEDLSELLTRAENTQQMYEQDRKNLDKYVNTINEVNNLKTQYESDKAELEEMGMFAPEYKKRIPTYIRRLGIVTAPTGAAVQDIRNISARRNPYVQLILYPALVQGEGAVSSIVNGIRALDALGVDVIIVGRGGGSIEDLWAFNEEEVARAIFECETPVISAVGHQTDTTIADFVADLRAPTPSAAAELAVFDHQAAVAEISAKTARMNRALQQKLDMAKLKVNQYQTKLQYLSPESKLHEHRRYAVDLEEKLHRQMEQVLTEKKHRLAILTGQMEGVSPLKKLSQGFSYVADETGKAVTDASTVKVGDPLTVHLLKGTLKANVTEVFDNE